MSENFTKPNRDLEARIARCDDAIDIATLLHEMNVGGMVQQGSAEPAGEPLPMLRKTVQAPDGRQIRISATSWYGIDVLSEGVRKGEITQDIV